MQTIRPLIAISILVLTLMETASAAGFGAFVEYGNVFDGQFSTGGDDFDYDEDHLGIGFSLDTNVAADRLFNYRLDVGYQSVDQTFAADTSFDGDGLVIDNSFGFGVLRNKDVRLWIGPGLRLSFDHFSDSDFGFDFSDFGIGAGPVVGLNIHTGDLVSLGISAGYQFSYVRTVFDDNSIDDDDGYEHLAFLKFHVLFRTDSDRFVLSN